MRCASPRARRMPLDERHGRGRRVGSRRRVPVASCRPHNRRTPVNRALCIGVSAYRSALGGPADLPGVEGDVAEISQLLSSGNSAKYGSMTVLRDEEATRERVLDELGKVLDAAPDDDVFIHTAGHGAVEDGAYYFVPHLGGAPFSPERAVPMTTIRERFEACRARRAVLFLDCCHTGASSPATRARALLIPPWRGARSSARSTSRAARAR